MAHIPRRLALATLATIVCCSGALAQTQAKLPDISGRWQFKTDVLPNKGCVISGQIEFRKGVKPFDYACTFVSREDCDREPEKTFTEVKQSCFVREIGGEFDITSKVEEITNAGPEWFKRQMLATMAYQPDNFRVHPKGRELAGTFKSILQAPVRFWRDVDLVS
jgi:hypothetical protein